MHEFESGPGGHELCGAVEARVIGPLVHHAQRHGGELAVVDVPEPFARVGGRVGLVFGEVCGERGHVVGVEPAHGVFGEHDHAE